MFESDAKANFLLENYCEPVRHTLLSRASALTAPRDKSHHESKKQFVRKVSFFFILIGSECCCGVAILPNTLLFITSQRLNPRNTFSYECISLLGQCSWSSGFQPDTMLLQKTNFRGIADSFVRIYNTLLYNFKS